MNDSTYHATLAKGAHTLISGIDAGGPGDGDLVSFTDAGVRASPYLDTRLFRLVTSSPTGTFELVDVSGQPIDSSAWDVLASTVIRGMAKQLVVGGSDPTKGGFGMRLIVSTQAGCDLSEYGLHHEPGPTGGTTWWASIDRFESLLATTPTPGPVLLTDVSFKEAAAHGRAGFLLAQSSGISSLTMLGGAITLAHPQAAFGSTGHANKLLMATGTGASPWALANTDLVVEEIALVDVTKLAAFTGRLTAQETAFTSASVGSYPGTLAVIQALAGQPQSTISTSARLVDALLGTLDLAGVLAKLDALHVFAAANETMARINLAAPASGPLALAGTGSAPGFAAWLGYTGTASGQYLLSPLAPTAQAHYGLNQATMAVVIQTITGAVVSRDVSLASTFAYVDPWSGATPQFHTKANDGTDTATTLSGVTTPAGFFAWSRTGTNTCAKYYGAGATVQPNMVAVSTSTSGQTLPTTGFEVLRGGSHQVSAAVFGGKLAQTEVNALYAALKTYLTAVGAWV